MAKRNSRNTRGRIISAAWKLFYEQGYDGTTVEDIVFESGTSKGSFYHYFDGKDALMGTLAYVFDEKYEDLMPTLNPEKGAIETLAYINHELYVMIESSVSIDLLTRLLSTQLLARGEKHLLDRSRVYFRLLKKIVRQGAERGEFRPGLAQEEIVRAFETRIQIAEEVARCKIEKGLPVLDRKREAELLTGACAAGTTLWWPTRRR